MYYLSEIEKLFHFSCMKIDIKIAPSKEISLLWSETRRLSFHTQCLALFRVKFWATRPRQTINTQINQGRYSPETSTVLLQSERLLALFFRTSSFSRLPTLPSNRRDGHHHPIQPAVIYFRIHIIAIKTKSYNSTNK